MLDMVRFEEESRFKEGEIEDRSTTEDVEDPHLRTTKRFSTTIQGAKRQYSAVGRGHNTDHVGSGEQNQIVFSIPSPSNFFYPK